MSNSLREAFEAGYWAGNHDGTDIGMEHDIDGEFDEWIEARASEEAGRYQRMQTFVRWMSADVDIRVMAAATCKTHAVGNVGELANLEPLLFDELYEAAEDLLEQIPRQERPGWMGQ
jgi:hypothetical protein